MLISRTSLQDTVQNCYKFELKPFKLKDCFTFAWIGNDFTVESIKHFNNMKYVLLGCQIVVYGGDPADGWIPLALSDNFEELALFADLQNLALLEVNKV